MLISTQTNSVFISHRQTAMTTYVEAVYHAGQQKETVYTVCAKKRPPFYSRPRMAPATADRRLLPYFGRVLSFSPPDFLTSLGLFWRNFATRRDVS